MHMIVMQKFVLPTSTIIVGLLGLELVLPGEHFRNLPRGLSLADLVLRAINLHFLHICLIKMQSG